jgi:outer membrane protein assembly factor BamA
MIPLLLLGSCNVTKPLTDNEKLLVNNKFRISTKQISQDDLSGYLQQVPNSKLFGMFRANIAFYNMGNKGKETKFKKWLRTKLGAPPVLLDTSQISVSLKQMRIYVNNRGYFNSTMYDSVVIRKKKATVYYILNASKPYTIRKISYQIPDTLLARYFFRDTASSLVKKGAIFNAYTMDSERTRIATNLLNHGFYHFATNFIVFRIDSSLNVRKMDVTVEITNPVVPSLKDFGAVVQSTHKRYFINNIYIYSDYDHLKADTITYDTLSITYKTGRKKADSTTYYFLYKGKFSIKPRTIAQNILIESDSVYNMTDVENTYSQLSGLQVFKYVNIGFDDIGMADDMAVRKNLLDCKIKLARSPANSFSVSTDATNSAGAFGAAGTLGFQNKNLFRGGQLFKINFSGTAQTQSGGGGGFFSTVEFGVNTSLTFPQFLIPIKPEKLPKHFRPKTVLTLGYNYQHEQDPSFTRHLVNASFGYTWRQSPRIEHTLNPVELLLVKMNPSAAFTEELDSIGDVRLINQYTSHIVAGLKYTISYSNQDIGKPVPFWYIRSNFETGGNLLYGITSLFNTAKNQYDQYTLFGIPYAEYVRPDVDVRYFIPVGKEHKVVTRFYGGIGIPYGNSNSLPYEKAFIAGGANDMRGWKMGTLGPGTYFNDTVSENLGQVGDMQLQLQIEYRFPIYGFFKGALFTDIGNVWILQPSSYFPGGQFQFNNFISQLGIDAGIGLRFDFGFFIFRFDPAIAMRVPSYPSQGHWYFSKMQLSDIIWNFGIGYPF